MSTHWLSIKPSDILTKAEMRLLSRQSDAMGWWLVAHCWGVIALAAWLYAIAPSVLTALIAVIIVGGRQLGLAILMHEASHGMLFKSRRLNDWLGQALIAWPVVIDMTLYRKRHMAHHRFTRTEKDPENFLYTPFPVTRGSMARKILRDLTGLVFVRFHVGLFHYVWGERDGRWGRLHAQYTGPLAANLALFGAALFADRVDIWLVCWLLPMMTSYQLFLRIRNIAEHATVPNIENPLQNSRTTLANWFERATVAPYWVNYHIEHHLMPFIPCYRLADLHRLMIREGYGDQMEICRGYRDVIKMNVTAAAEA